MFKIKYPFAKLPLFQAFLDYVNEFKLSIDTLTLVDIQNLMVDPDGELYAYLRAFSDKLINFDKDQYDYKRQFDEELTALTENILACETKDEARTLLNNELNDILNIVEEFTQIFNVNGIEEAFALLATFRALAELKFSPLGLSESKVRKTFDFFLQIGYLNGQIVGGIFHVPTSFIEQLNNSEYPSLQGNSITDGCVELDIVKVIQYAIDNQEFTL